MLRAPAGPVPAEEEAVYEEPPEQETLYEEPPEQDALYEEPPVVSSLQQGRAVRACGLTQPPGPPLRGCLAPGCLGLLVQQEVRRVPSCGRVGGEDPQPPTPRAMPSLPT